MTKIERIPYGSTTLFVGPQYVTIGPIILTRSDYPTPEDLQAAIEKEYMEWQARILNPPPQT